jgi:hypothetical protein
MTYDYRQPRRINVVSVFMLLVAVAAGYAGYKFVPVYWQARKVDQVLDEEKLAMVNVGRLAEEHRAPVADKAIAKAITRLYEMGIEDVGEQPLQVWFSPDYGELNARYQVVVRHPVGKATVLTFDRHVTVPRD